MPRKTYGLLGRRPSIDDPRTLRLSSFLAKHVDEPPASRRWDTPVTEWGVMGNNDFGNCVIATAAHMILNWRANELADTRRITDNAVIQLSGEMGALNGFDILTRLKYWRSQTMWADRLWAFAKLEPKDRRDIRIAINHHGAADIGLAMPAAWQTEPDWTTGTGPRYRFASWGYHSVPLIGYDADHVYAVTWGRLQSITWPAIEAYCDEAWAAIDPCWFAADHVSPAGLDLPALHAALCDIGANVLQLPPTPRNAS